MDGPGFDYWQGCTQPIMYSVGTADYWQGCTQPVMYSVGTADSFPRGKAAGHEADHSSPPTSKVMNEWSYTSASPICFHGVHTDNFTFNNAVCC